MEDLRPEKAVAAVCIVAVAAMLKFHRESEPAEPPLPFVAGTAGMDELWRDAVGARTSLQQVPKEDIVLDPPVSEPWERRSGSLPPGPRRSQPPRPGEDDIYASPKGKPGPAPASPKLKPKSFSFFDGGSKATTSAFLAVPKDLRKRPAQPAAQPPAPAEQEPSAAAPSAAASSATNRRPMRALSSRASAGP